MYVPFPLSLVMPDPLPHESFDLKLLSPVRDVLRRQPIVQHSGHRRQATQVLLQDFQGLFRAKRQNLGVWTGQRVMSDCWHDWNVREQQKESVTCLCMSNSISQTQLHRKASLFSPRSRTLQQTSHEHHDLKTPPSQAPCLFVHCPPAVRRSENVS